MEEETQRRSRVLFKTGPLRWPRHALHTSLSMRVKACPDTRTNRRTSRRGQQLLDSAPRHRYFLRSSARTNHATIAASNNSPHTPLSKKYKPLELAKMSREARKSLWEEERVAAENKTAQTVTEGTNLHSLRFLSPFLMIISHYRRKIPGQHFPAAQPGM